MVTGDTTHPSLNCRRWPVCILSQEPQPGSTATSCDSDEKPESQSAKRYHHQSFRDIEMYRRWPFRLGDVSSRKEP